MHLLRLHFLPHCPALSSISHFEETFPSGLFLRLEICKPIIFSIRAKSALYDELPMLKIKVFIAIKYEF